jgi:ribose transport system substrate-binding protein
MVAKSQNNPVFLAAYSGAKDAAKELGDKYNANIEILWRTPSDENPQYQADQIASLANEHVDGITVSCSNAAILTPAINDASDKNIPVVCFDSDAPDSKRLTDYGTDDTICGQIIMREVARFMGDKGGVAILSGNQAAPNLALRVQGAEDELAKHPNMTLVNVYNTKEDADSAVELINKEMANNPGKINGWAMIGGWPLFTDHALDQMNGAQVVSCDALPKELQYLRNGQAQELVAQDCYGWGYQTVQILLEKIVNGKDPSAKKIPNPLTLVTKDAPDPSLPVDALTPRMKLADFEGYWKKWMPDQK